MMSAYTDEFAYQSNNYGVKIETAPLHPGFLAIGTPWRSGWQHKERMADAAHLGHFVLFARDQDAGHITLSPTHQPQIHYQLSPRDLRHLLVGMGAATRIHLAAGAQRVQLPHRELPTYEASHEIPSLEQIFEHIARTYRWKKNDFPLFSAHQMGTCRMGGNASTAPLTPEGETRECKGLFVADGSVFPGSCGTNPMLTIMAMAHHTAQHIKSRSKYSASRTTPP
jgi:choline dehydrogenase-like flavoprotein